MKKTMIPGLDFEIGTLFCIGKNYAQHVREMGSELPEAPVVFFKPRSSICFTGGMIELPPQSKRVDHEVELVVAIGRGGKNIAQANAQAHIAGYGIGLDITARDIQEQAKKKNIPWAVAKGFDTFAVLGPFVRSQSDPSQLKFALEVNGELRQKGDTSQMLFSVTYLISYLSSIFTLQAGDLIFTGTPEGIGPLAAGDRLKAWLEEPGSVLEVGVRNAN